MRHKSDQNALVTAAGMGAVMYMLDKIKKYKKCKKMQKNEKYRFLHLREVGVPSRNIVHGRGVGSKSRIRVTRIVGSSCAQHAREKYKLIRGTAKKALLKHLLVTAARMRTVMYLLVFKRSQNKVLFCNKMLKPYSTV